ncbi:MAG TPA: efflux RND transporter periplasmic adaptor subunit [Xanthobacteraceae bacterium]|nr:efflux RND transporter periplasmic adaptor subunit [Xanthobacteraceae bacterium]
MSAPAEPPAAPQGRLVPFPHKIQPKAGSRRTMVHWLAGGSLAALLMVAAAAWLTFGSGNTVHYAIAPVSRGPITRTVTATGTVNPELTIIVGSYVSGVIQKLYCDYNTEVTEGQTCAKIDPRPYQTVVDQNKANLAVAKAQLVKDQASLAYAKVTYERNSKLGQTNAVSQDAVDSAKNAYDQAQAQITFDQATIQQRQAELDTAQVNLDYTNIISPVKGTVVSRNVTMGQTVAASFQTPTLFLIATDLTKMEVDTNVSESDVGGIKVGDKATFAVDAYPKRTFEGAVTQVRQSPQNVQNVITYDIVVGVANADLALMPGMTAATRIIVDERKDVVRVPVQALRYLPAEVASAAAQVGVPAQPPSSGGVDESGRGRVWLLRDGQPVETQVVVGLDDESNAEIVEGDIKPGDSVIVSEQRGAGAQSRLPVPRL